jgi:hypothetical protein
MDKLAQWELQPAVEAIGHSDAKDRPAVLQAEIVA